MGKRKAADEIAAEIAALKELLPVLSKSKRAIQVQIDVLENGLSHDAVYDQFEDSDLFDDANDVRMWRDGDSSSEAMSGQWKEMI
jgi:hypothetical protein